MSWYVCFVSKWLSATAQDNELVVFESGEQLGHRAVQPRGDDMPAQEFIGHATPA
jgi:hypothetical protein